MSVAFRLHPRIAAWTAVDFWREWGTGMHPHLTWILRQPRPEITCSSRARGCWDANLLEDMAKYERLAALIRDGAFTPRCDACGVVTEHDHLGTALLCDRCASEGPTDDGWGDAPRTFEGG